MVRTLVLALLLLNAAYFAWSQGLLASLGMEPGGQAEPQRLAWQIEPQAIRLLTPEQFKQLEDASSAKPGPQQCLHAGPLDAVQSAAVRSVLESSWPAGSWEMQTVTQPQRWIVYLGKFANMEALQKKRSEIAAMRVQMEPLNAPALEPGISLGGFATQALAQEGLVQISKRGVRSARVVQELAGGTAFALVLPAVGDALNSQLGALKAALGSKALTPCAQLPSGPG